MRGFEVELVWRSSDLSMLTQVPLKQRASASYGMQWSAVQCDAISTGKLHQFRVRSRLQRPTRNAR